MKSLPFIFSLVIALPAIGQSLNVRTITATTAVEQASVPSAIPYRWYQGESVTFQHWSTQAGTNADWSTLTNLVAVWTLTANKTESPDDTNAYLWVTGTVGYATGLVTFAATPEETAMPSSNYWSYVTLYQTDGTGATNQFIGVLNRATAYVGYRDMHPTYVGPWQVPSNMVDSYARALAVSSVAAHNTNGAAHADIRALSTNATDALARAGVIAVSGRVDQVEIDSTNALAIAQALDGAGLAVLGDNWFLSPIAPYFSFGATNIVNVTSVYFRVDSGGIDFQSEIGRYALGQDVYGNLLLDVVREDAGPAGLVFAEGVSIRNTAQGAGTAGQFLMTGGDSAAPIWADALTNGTINGVTGTVSGGKVSVNLAAAGSSVTNLTFWTGSAAAYAALSVTNAKTLYIVTP